MNKFVETWKWTHRFIWLNELLIRDKTQREIMYCKRRRRYMTKPVQELECFLLLNCTVQLYTCTEYTAYY